MTTTVDAVYEHGVLRLMEPMLLPEGTHVEVTVTPKMPVDMTRTPAQILAGIAAMAATNSDEEWTSRDHDKVLYGEQGAK